MIEENNNLPSQDAADSGRNGDCRPSACSALVLQSAEASKITGWGTRARRGRFAIHSEARPAVILLENVEWTSRIPRNAAEADHINREAKRLSTPNVPTLAHADEKLTDHSK